MFMQRFDRKDGIINLCEMKYSENEYSIDASYEKELLHKQSAFMTESGTKKELHITMVTSDGLKRNAHWQVAVNELSADALFS